MNIDVDDESGCFTQNAMLKELERQLFAHILELGDLRNLSGLEQVLYCVLSDKLESTLAMDLSRLMVNNAVEQVVRDPMRDISSVPHGISRAERFAAFFEKGCPFCESKVDLEPLEDEAIDDCECCEMLVREWRAEHADALKQFAKVAAQKH